VVYLLGVAIAAALGLALVALHERRQRRRQQAIRELLDGADALEAQLQECRERMQHLRDLLRILPAEMSARADHALRADAKVQAALRDLLAHRLWIQQHAAAATPSQIHAARTALVHSGSTLAALLRCLADVGGELERAQAGAQTAGRKPP
jgi:translation initiation factor 2B subunit (eIF-2B alpha/beta/delta family)